MTNISQYENETSFVLMISESYSGIHGWLSLVICSVGIPFSIFDMIVLNKANIASLATNTILISIAFCDIVLMAAYFPFSVHFYILNSNSHSSEGTAQRDTFFWTHYSLFNIFISVTFHSITMLVKSKFS